MNNIFQEKVQKIMVLFVMALGLSCVSFGVVATTVAEAEREVQDADDNVIRADNEVAAAEAADTIARNSLEAADTFARNSAATARKASEDYWVLGGAQQSVRAGTVVSAEEVEALVDRRVNRYGVYNSQERVERAERAKIMAEKALGRIHFGEEGGRNAVQAARVAVISAKRVAAAQVRKQQSEERFQIARDQANNAQIRRVAAVAELQRARTLVDNGPTVQDVIRVPGVPGVPGVPKLERSRSRNPIVQGVPRISPSSTGTKPGKGRTQDIEKDEE